jgi:hypothetical protein
MRAPTCILVAAAALSAAGGSPERYDAPRSAAPVRIDGKLDDAVWQSAAWTDDFVDIEGAHKPKPRFRTRAKIAWDDTYLYFAAEMEEPHVWGTLTQHDSVVFHDNDFEVFIDPNGDTLEYYEFEINALNTGWDLFLNKPYRFKGKADNKWEIPGLKTAVHVDGTLNDPRDTDRGWSVEIAMPWKALGPHPHAGKEWRINFSRVEWQHQTAGGKYSKVKGLKEDNWVWSPQGVINMHVPQQWGFVRFTETAAAAGYQRDVKPILAQRCVMCHQGVKAAASIDLSRFDVLHGLALDNRLLGAIAGSPPRMPKGMKPLDPGQVETIRSWIAAGAKNDGPAEEKWWSLRALPDAVDPRAGIDSFIAAKWKAAGIAGSPEADRRTLIRRVTYDLTGLPPSPGEVGQFIADPSPRAYEQLVNRLLASPRYGERWARHWLDVAHYGDSHGYDKDKPRPNAWPYRDWVIGALNRDLPYSDFIRQQIAGDELNPRDPQALAATGFLAAGPWDFVGHQELKEGTVDKNLTRLMDRDDIVAQVMSTFTSTTAHCARCHYHKFDPIPQEDYYRLQAVFAGIDRADRPFDDDPELHVRRQALLSERRSLQLEMQPLLDKTEFASSPAILELDIRISDAGLLIAHIGEPKTPAEAEEKKKLTERREADRKRRAVLVDEIVGAEAKAELARLQIGAKALDEKLAALPAARLVYGPANFFARAGTFRPALEPRPISLLARGDVKSPLQRMEPGALSMLGLPLGAVRPGEEASYRAALAEWLASPANILTWRSIVNRVWHYHFGAGLVDTPNDFGRLGSQPTHPELLDWLAVWFRDEARGSLKQLHRLIVTSAVYRQASNDRPEPARVDASNRLLWRMNRARLEAEAVRDAVLQTAGKLDPAQGGPPVRMFLFKDDHSPIYDYARFDPGTPGANRRSIYRFIVRSVPDPFMDRLDCPDPSVLAPKRNTTLTAIQALALMNNPFMVRMSQAFAARLASEAPAGLPAQVRHAVQLVYQREPRLDEQQEMEAYATSHGLANLCRLLFNTNEFLFAD